MRLNVRVGLVQFDRKKPGYTEGQTGSQRNGCYALPLSACPAGTEAIDQGHRSPCPQQGHCKEASIVIARAVSNPVMERHKGIPEDVRKEDKEQQNVPSLLCKASLLHCTRPNAIDEGKQWNEWEGPYKEMQK